VDISFTDPYLEQPIVNASISLNSGDADVLSAVEGDIFNNNIQYIVVNKSENGFTILLNKVAPDDITFSWTAFAVKDAKTFGTPSVDTSSVSSSSSVVTPPSSDSVTSTTATTTDQTDSSDASSTATSTPQIASSTPDTIPPVITMNGDESVSIHVGDTYTDLGATATDNVDGTDSVTTSGTVDTMTAGIYTITYTATDVAGNTATATRTVNVAAAPSEDEATSSDATSTAP
jgi:hypothetical protein